MYTEIAIQKAKKIAFTLLVTSILPANFYRGMVEWLLKFLNSFIFNKSFWITTDVNANLGKKNCNGFWLLDKNNQSYSIDCNNKLTNER